MKIFDRAKEIVLDIKSAAENALAELRQIFGKLSKRQAERITQEVMNGKSDPEKMFRDLLKQNFDSQARRLKHDFRSWRTTFTNKWKYKAGELLDNDKKPVYWMWICVFRNSRESHMYMHRQKRRQGEPFISGNNNELRYPGDRSAPIEEWINCQCYLVRDK